MQKIWSQIADAIQSPDVNINKDMLVQIVAKCKELDLLSFEEVGRQNFKKAIRKCEELLTNEEITESSLQNIFCEMMIAGNNLKYAEQSLNKSLLNYMLQEEALVAKRAEYYEQDENWQQFISALKMANSVCEQAVIQSEINYAAVTLANVCENIRLVTNSEHVQKFERLLQKMYNMNLDVFTNDQILYIQDAIASIEKLKNQKNFKQAEYNEFLEMENKIEDMVNHHNLKKAIPFIYSDNRNNVR